MRVELSRRAEADIEAQTAYGVEVFGEAQAERYFAGLYHLFDLLADNPEMGTAYGGGRRRLTYRTHHVYY